jgi:hypothetical protein
MTRYLKVVLTAIALVALVATAVLIAFAIGAGFGLIACQIAGVTNSTLTLTLGSATGGAILTIISLVLFGERE